MLENYPYIALFVSMIMQVIIPPLPAEIIVVTAGRIYDVTLTTLFGGAGLYIGSTIVFFIGRFIHLKLHRFFDRQKIKRVIDRIKKIETILLWVRILPYNPSDIISYAAGIVNVRTAKFLFITACTSFTRVFVLSVLGRYITNMKTLIQVVTILIISAFIGAAVAYGNENRK